MSSPFAKEPVDGELECNVLQARDFSHSVRFSALPKADRHQLEQQLAQEHVEILHFVGHGFVDDAGGSYLAFQGAQESSVDFISAAQLSQWVYRGGVRVIGLQTPHVPNHEAAAIAHLAAAVAEIGADAVVFSLLDQEPKYHVQAFDRFYSSLCDGVSVAEAYRYAVKPFESPPLGLHLCTPNPYPLKFPSMAEQTSSSLIRFHMAFRGARRLLNLPRRVYDKFSFVTRHRSAVEGAEGHEDEVRYHEASPEAQAPMPEVGPLASRVRYRQQRLNELRRRAQGYHGTPPEWLTTQIAVEEVELQQLAEQLRTATVAQQERNHVIRGSGIF